MDSLVEEARKHSQERDNSFGDISDPNIVVVGCGGAGNNTIDRLHNIGISGAETVAINTDKQHLTNTRADKTVLIGSSLTDGKGAGGEPEIAAKAARNASQMLKEEVLDGADLVFITAGMGGGTGTGASPVVAEIAKDMNAIVVGMVSTPFDTEKSRHSTAREGIRKMQQYSDSVILLNNQRLLDYVPELPIEEAFSVMDQIIAETVKGISETISEQSLINLDYADLSQIMQGGGVSVMLVGETQQKDKKQVVDNALEHPLLDVDYRNANGGLIHITGGPNMTLSDADSIASQLTSQLADDSQVMIGARVNDEYRENNKVQVLAIMTGVDSSQVLSGLNDTSSQSTPQSENESADLDLGRKKSTSVDVID